jgi:hypothetical protein
MPIGIKSKLVLIFILGLFLRLVFIPMGALTFSYDQGRDAFISQQIIHGDLKIQGPPSSTPGLFHGVFYYYLLAPFYLMGRGSPYYPAVGMAVINCLGVFLIYVFAKKLTNSDPVSLSLSLLYAVSFEQSQYAVWLSNPAYAAFTVPLFYYFLWRSHGGVSYWSYILAGLFLGLSVQAEIFLAYHLTALIILWLTRDLPFKPSFIFRFFGGLIIGLFPMLVAQIKFGFTGISALSHLLIPTGLNQTRVQFTDTAFIYLNQLTKTFALNLFPVQIYLGGLIGLGLVFWLIKAKVPLFTKRIILAYIFSSFIAFPFGGVATPFVHVGIGFGIYLLLGMYLQKLYLSRRPLFILVISVLAISNLLAIFKNNNFGQTIFALQPDLTLKNETSVINFIYQSQKGAPFSLNTITSPLHINTAWSYLFNWYGVSNYGYLPYWHGHNQIGSLGNNLSSPPKSVTDYYLVIDPPEPNFVQFINSGIEEENGFSKPVQEYKFGTIRVQHRVRI